MSKKKPKWTLEIDCILGSYGWSLQRKRTFVVIEPSELYWTWQKAYSAGVKCLRELAEGVDIETAKKESK